MMIHVLVHKKSGLPCVLKRKEGTEEQLALNGKGRDGVVKGLEKDSGLSHLVLFHQVDVADATSVASLADFIKSKFGKLDILINNAGISGVVIDDTDLITTVIKNRGAKPEYDGTKGVTHTYELAEECLQINYYGAKKTTESLMPLLQLSDSPRIVNVSSSLGQLESLPKGSWARGVFNDVDNLTAEIVDEILNKFLRDFKEGSLESKGWPKYLSAYIVSKAAMNAYTRILAKKYPSFCINSVCPGYVKTDITANTGILTVEEGAASPVRLLHSTANQVALMSPAEVELPGSQINHSLPQKGMSSKSNRCKRWSQEHRLFLLGLEKHGSGDWKNISRIIETRTPLQVASHAQKYFLRQALGDKAKRRSINDI
ncbi:hypothetical protein JHK85_018263 [Glycine max]|nr:hypothetical protein JHK85_018263 [Glycine max]